MKKRLKKKIEKNFCKVITNNFTKKCDECGYYYQITVKELIVVEPYIGEINLKGYHPVCQSCGQEIFSFFMINELKRKVKMKTRELLLKNYPFNNVNYVSIDDIDYPNVHSLNDYEFPVFYIKVKKKKFFLKQSYELFKENNINGYFNL